jgi:hypothetical protein
LHRQAPATDPVRARHFRCFRAGRTIEPRRVPSWAHKFRHGRHSAPVFIASSSSVLLGRLNEVGAAPLNLPTRPDATERAKPFESLRIMKSGALTAPIRSEAMREAEHAPLVCTEA